MGRRLVLLFIHHPIRLSGTSPTRTVPEVFMSAPASAHKPLQAPVGGEPISMKQGRMQVPTTPIIPFIEGDGTGPDIWRASQFVFDHAVERAYGKRRRIAWLEVYAGEKAKA